MASFSSASTSAGSSVGNALGIGGALMSGIGSYYSGQAQKSALQYQASVAESNARMAEKSAQSALLHGQQQQNQIQLRTAAMKGSQRASLAASGVDLGEGSAAQIQTTTDVMGKIDADTVAANAVRTAWGYRTQGTNYQNEALIKQAGADSMSPMSSAFGSLLTSAASVSRNWYSYNKVAVDSQKKQG